MEFILPVLAIAGLVWGGILLTRGGLFAGALLVMLSGCCFGYPFFHLAGGPMPITVDRLLLAAVFGLAVFARWRGHLQGRVWNKADYVFAVFMVVLVASTITHDYQYNKSQPLSQLVFFYLMPAMLYWVVRQTELGEREMRWLFGSLAAFGVYLSITAMAETRGVWSLVFPSYIGSTEFVEFYGRGRGPFLNPVGLGIYLGVCMCAALMAWPRVGRVGKLGLLALSLVYLGGMYCTLTRSVWMGAALSLLVVVGLALPKRVRTGIVVSLLLAGVVGATTSWDSLLMFKRDKNVKAEDVADSAKLRPILATVAWHMFQDKPLWGFGYGQYTQEKDPYLADRSSDLPLEKTRPYVQHCVFLELLVELGLAGLVSFVVLLGLWMQEAWRLWANQDNELWRRQCGLLFLGLVANYLPNGLFHDVSLISMVNMLVFFMAGVLTSVSRSTATAPQASFVTSRRVGNRAWA